MRKLLIAGVALVALSGTAHAQLAVADIAAEIGISKDTIETIKNGLTELQQLQTEAQQLQQYIWMGENIIHNPVAGTLQVANMVGLSSALPVNPYAVMSLTSGYGGMNSLTGMLGKASQLGGLVNASFANDSLYHCTTDSFECRQANITASANAGTKGIGAQLIADLQSHVPVLQGLQARLATASSPKDVSDIQAQIQVQHAAIDDIAAQAGATAMLNQAQVQVASAQRVEKLNSDADSFFAGMPK